MEGYVKKEYHKDDENEFMVYFFDYWMEHYEVLDILIAIGRYDIIFQCHYNNAPILYKYFTDAKAYIAPVRNFKYYMYFRIGPFVGILIAWVDGGRKEKAEELISLLRKDIADPQPHALFL